MPTPLIRKLKENGTFVVFQSTGEDLSIDRGQSQLRYSHFACLNIPIVETPTDNRNNIQFEAVEGSFTQGLSADTPAPEGDRTDLAESLQNYLLNLEESIIRNEGYNANLPRTVSERIFFKWLKEIGGIRYREAIGGGEKIATLSEKRFVEEDDNTDSGQGDLYDGVVKYVGEIDIDVNQKYNKNGYKQLYFYIPKENGSTPTVLFKTIIDENYSEGTFYKKVSDGNVELIEGRDDTDDNPTSAGLRIDAQYDHDVDSGYTYTMNTIADDIWFLAQAPNGPNAYYTDATFDDPENDTINRDQAAPPKSIDYLRSRLDGVCIDFKTENYHDFNENALLTGFAKYSGEAAANDFSFNAIAIYHTVTDPDTGEDIENMWGVLFLNNMVVVSGTGAQIDVFNKIKPSDVLSKQGNGLGFSVNIKFDVTNPSVDTDVEVTVNDFNTFSMIVFAEALSYMTLAGIQFQELIDKHQEVITKVNDLEQLLLTGDSATAVKLELESLKEQINGVVNSDGLLDLINANKAKIDEILAGGSSIDVNLLYQIITRGGLKHEVLEPSSTLILDLDRQRYSSAQPVDFDVTINNNGQNEFLLGQWDTLIVHSAGGVSKTAEDNLFIYIDDKTNPWKINQSLEIEFQDGVDFSEFSIFIYTDSLNKLGLGAAYQKLIGSVQPSENKPSIRIVCTNASTLEFILLAK